MTGPLERNLLVRAYARPPWNREIYPFKVEKVARVRQRGKNPVTAWFKHTVAGSMGLLDSPIERRLLAGQPIRAWLQNRYLALRFTKLTRQPFSR